jgi:hypothetical protein
VKKACIELILYYFCNPISRDGAVGSSLGS